MLPKDKNYQHKEFRRDCWEVNVRNCGLKLFGSSIVSILHCNHMAISEKMATRGALFLHFHSHAKFGPSITYAVPRHASGPRCCRSAERTSQPGQAWWPYERPPGTCSALAPPGVPLLLDHSHGDQEAQSHEAKGPAVKCEATHQKKSSQDRARITYRPDKPPLPHTHEHSAVCGAQDTFTLNR